MPTTVSHPELEGGLEDHPEDSSRWAAYADWLSSRGDPRGESISINLALESEKARRPRNRSTERLDDLVSARIQHRQQAETELRGAAGCEIDVRWERPLISETRVAGAGDARALRDLLTVPWLRFVEVLKIELARPLPLKPFLESILAAPCARAVRVIHLRGSAPANPPGDISALAGLPRLKVLVCNEPCQLTGRWSALESLTLQGDSRLDGELPSLRRLSVTDRSLTWASPAQAVPALEELTIHCAARKDQSVSPLLLGDGPPALKELTLRDAPGGVVAALGKTKLLPRLKRLHLPGLDVPGFRELHNFESKLTHLFELDLRGCPPDLARPLHAKLPGIVVL